MKISIYVMTHKKFTPPSDSIYIPLHVGRDIGNDLGYIGDNTGENISGLNPFFGELTGLYWVWKNDTDSDIIGVNHYRRFFINSSGHPMTGEEIISVLSDHDLITTDPNKSTISNREGYGDSHNINDLMEVGKAIDRLCPEYRKDFDWDLEAKGGYYGNLCIMPRDMYMSYCQWLFEILFDASENIDVSGYDLYHKRVYGFLSELLMQMWIHHHRLMTYECPVGYTMEKAETVELKRVIGMYVRNGQISEARQMYYDITRMRPDVLMPTSDLSGELLIIEQILYILDEEKKEDLEGMYSYSHELKELVEYYLRVRELVYQDSIGKLKGKEKEEIDHAVISDIAREIMLKFH